MPELPDEAGQARLQPLCAAYRASALARALERALEHARAGRPRRLQTYFDQAVPPLSYRRFTLADLTTAVPSLASDARALQNINTPADYERLIGPLPPDSSDAD